MAGIITQGTSFGISVDGVTYTEIGVIQNFTQSTAARNEIDTTGLLDDSKTFKFGLKDNGTFSIELLLDLGSVAQGLLDDSYSSNDAFFFEIEYSDIITPVTGNGTTKTFQGYVTSLSVDTQSDEVLRQSVEIKISGDIVETPAS